MALTWAAIMAGGVALEKPQKIPTSIFTVPKLCGLSTIPEKRYRIARLTRQTYLGPVPALFLGQYDRRLTHPIFTD